MGFAGIVGCCGLPFGALVAALVGATLLRAAVAAANRVLGPAVPPDAFGLWDDWDSDEPAPKPRRRGARVVPEPGLVTGLLVVFVAGLADAVGYAALAVFFNVDPDDLSDEAILVVLFLLAGVPVSALVHAALLDRLLPTTFGRAALVSLFYHLILAVIALLVGGAGLLAWYATGP